MTAAGTGSAKKMDDRPVRAVAPHQETNMQLGPVPLGDLLIRGDGCHWPAPGAEVKA